MTIPVSEVFKGSDMGRAFPCFFGMSGIKASDGGETAGDSLVGGHQASPVDRRKWRRERKQLRIALIDSRPLILDALAHRFRIAIRKSQILLFSTAEDLLGDPSTYESVDLVVVSARSAYVVSGEILTVVRELCARAPEKPVIIITDRDEADSIAAMIKEGARGCIPTSCAIPVAVAALEVVMAGGTFAPVASLINASASRAAVEPVVQGHGAPDDPLELMLPGTSANGDAEGGAALTAREVEVLSCLAKGGSNKMIARELRLREGTVKVHIRHLMTKLNAANRTQLALRSHCLLARTGHRE